MVVRVGRLPGTTRPLVCRWVTWHGYSYWGGCVSAETMREAWAGFIAIHGARGPLR